MVRSGLGEEVKDSKKEIRVSPYRLATHLAMAFTTFSCLLWTGEVLCAVLMQGLTVSTKKLCRAILYCIHQIVCLCCAVAVVFWFVMCRGVISW